MAITRTHFAYRIDLWTDDEKEVVEHLADVDDLTVALATYHAAVERWPGKAITLRQGRHVIEDSRRSRLATLFHFRGLTSRHSSGQGRNLRSGKARLY